jgi:hypothetical protein
VKALMADGTMKSIAEEWKLPLSTVTGVGE